MSSYEVKLLDCTLRDGGYINEWNWGYKKARDIIQSLVKANVDMVEVGFLRNIDQYQEDITVCSKIEDLNRLLPDDGKNTMFSAMAMQSNYDINKLSPYSGTGIELIRITAHDYDIKDGMKFAQQVKEKGYKLAINPINIMGYSDSEILWIIEQVNKILPYQFSIVDTFGSMKRRDLDRIVSLADHNLNSSIRLGLHLHENMAMSCSLAQSFIDCHLHRPITVDGSLMGMGRIPGNLPIELISDYMNDYIDKNYDIDYMMEAIQDYIAPIKQKSTWGYTPAYFLSARYNLHRNYAEYYLEKGDLTNRDINHILSRISETKKTVFDSQYAEELYEEYKNNKIDDTAQKTVLKDILRNKTILVLAPGFTLNTHREQILDFITKEEPIIISANFIPDRIKTDFAFFSNNKRYNKAEKNNVKIIATSNLSSEFADYYLDYNSLTIAFEYGCNSLILLLKLLKEMEAVRILVAGADGFVEGEKHYCNPIFMSNTQKGKNFNTCVSNAIKSLELNIEFITPSAYSV